MLIVEYVVVVDPSNNVLTRLHVSCFLGALRFNGSPALKISLGWAIALAGLSLSSVGSPINTANAEAGFPGWDSISIIYYDPGQEDAKNNFVEQAANDLKEELEKVSGTTFNIETATRPATGIFISVDPNLPEFESRNHEAFKLLTDSNGVHITGKSPVAARHGTYAFLETLGYRYAALRRQRPQQIPLAE